jgi:hypothetical protein
VDDAAIPQPQKLRISRVQRSDPLAKMALVAGGLLQDCVLRDFRVFLNCEDCEESTRGGRRGNPPAEFAKVANTVKQSPSHNGLGSRWIATALRASQDSAL